MKRIVKEINAKRIQEIENYMLSLNDSVCNPNLKGMFKVNPIAGAINLEQLKLLREELSCVDIDIREITLEAIYGQVERTQTDLFITNIANGLAYLNYIEDYKKMLEAEELENIFPIVERKKRIEELEKQIEKHNKFIDTFKGNKSLCKSREEKILEATKEIESLEVTMQIKTKENITNLLYSMAIGKLNSLREQCENKINYLEGVQA